MITEKGSGIPQKNRRKGNTMKEILKRLNAAIEAGNAADDAWEKDPENAELEKAFDETYKAEYAIRKELAAAIVKATAGQIDEQTAFKMTYNPKLAELIESAA